MARKSTARVARTTTLVFGWLAILSLILKWDMSRGYLAFAFPLGLLGLLFGRKFWRGWLARERARSIAFSRVLVIGVLPLRRSESLRTFTPLATADTASLGSGCLTDLATLNQWLDIPAAFIPVLGTQRTLMDVYSITEADAASYTTPSTSDIDGLKDLAGTCTGPTSKCSCHQT